MIEVFENFKFKIGDVVLRVTDNGDQDKGIIVARSLNEFTSGVNRSYSVSFGHTILLRHCHAWSAHCPTDCTMREG